jgi:hypothetical protein
MLVSRSVAAMSDILAVGLTHYPPLLGTDADMSWTLEYPDIPAAAKDLSNWRTRSSPFTP